MTSLSYLFRLGHSTVSKIISETTESIWNVLQPILLVPPSEEEWYKIAEGFANTWQFPNCIGAIDGKHIQIQVLNLGSYNNVLFVLYLLLLGPTKCWK